MKEVFTFIFICVSPLISRPQLKYLVEDFEGMEEGIKDFKQAGIFTFGNISGGIVKEEEKNIYSGERFIRLNRKDKQAASGWGRGVSSFIELDVNTDYLNFYVYTNDTNTIKVELQEDDNGDMVFKKGMDDAWVYIAHLDKKEEWQLISIPLKNFSDKDPGGDNHFNISYRHGKLLTFLISFIDTRRDYLSWSFDFVCFSQGKLRVSNDLVFHPVKDSDNNFCSLGAWSAIGNSGKFHEIAHEFEKNYYPKKKLAIVHFFQPFGFDRREEQNHLPSVDRINKIIQEGYIPMITLEHHYISSSPKEQPNLYSITEGHFDLFLKAWANQVKKVDGTVLLRILHEFNGDWYPWCIANNDKNPELIIKAFRHIHSIFEKQKVNNVKFIWCPNSTSFPQEKWNFILDAYPGDEYVDFVGLDIYNGAGKGLPVWRSFRKEGIENYFILTRHMPSKPLIICETASRERNGAEINGQTKAEWIKQMSHALTSDMSKIHLLTWFNEKKTYPVNSSLPARNAFQHYIIQNPHFIHGTKQMELIQETRITNPPTE